MAGKKTKPGDPYDREFERMEAMERFIDLVADGCPEVNAALEVGWTPRVMQSYLQDSSFRDMVSAARDRADGTIEQKLFAVAKGGNMTAIQMWLFNRQPERWRDLKRIEIHTDSTVKVEVVGAVKEAAMAMLNQLGVAKMQELPAFIDVESVELPVPKVDDADDD